MALGDGVAAKAAPQIKAALVWLRFGALGPVAISGPGLFDHFRDQYAHAREGRATTVESLPANDPARRRA